MVNTQKALDLYLLLKDHFPEEKSEFDITTLISIIIDSIIEKNQYVNYHRSLMIMHDLSLDIIKDANPQDLLNMFAEGLLENNVVELMSFFREKTRYGIP